MNLKIPSVKKCLENVSDFFPSYKQAAWEKDIKSMIDLYDENVTIFDLWGDKGFSTGLKEWSEIITDWLTSLNEEKVNVTFEMIEILEDESIAFASALIQYQAIGMNNEVLRQMKNRISVGFVKVDGHWKVKHQHTSAPIDSNLSAIFEI